MSVELKVPAVGESITEVQIGRWLKSEGQSASKDEPLVELESDKATVELPAPEAGQVARILKQQGEKAQVGEVIGYLETAESKTSSPSSAAPPDVVAETKPAEQESKPAAKPAQPTPAAEAEPRSKPESKPAQPAAQPPAIAPAAKPAASVPAQSFGLPLADWAADNQPRQEKTVPMSPLRRRIAERLVEAQQTAALLTTFNEIDMSRVIALRNLHKESFQRQYGVKLGFMSFFVRATIDALRHVPQVGAEVRGQDVVYRNYADIGIAVGSGKGLVVPVLRDAERMSFSQIELAISDFAHRAQENQLKLEELRGGTFTISNGGVYGSLLSTPIVNPPQSGILGLHAIQDRPIALEGQVVIRPMMYVALTYDHRIVDGREAVTFLRRIKDVIEEPVRLLLDV
ncbi:MAG: 2-oxoglutarate dehydrogenase complex dihydrolipoyllysine-residue succinyltransferase [Pirellulales bacterium]